MHTLPQTSRAQEVIMFLRSANHTGASANNDDDEFVNASRARDRVRTQERLRRAFARCLGANPANYHARFLECVDGKLKQVIDSSS
jgi:hypothetical protein